MFGVLGRVREGVHADTDDTPDGKSRSTQSVIRGAVNDVYAHARAGLGLPSDSGSSSSESSGDSGGGEGRQAASRSGNHTFQP